MMRVSRRTLLRGGVGLASLGVAGLTASCATLPTGTSSTERVTATQALDRAWSGENEATRAANATRLVHATPDQAWRAARAGLGRIGLDIDDVSSKPPNLRASTVFKGGGWSWSPTVREVEEARIRAIFVKAIGPKGANLVITPADETLVGTVAVGPAAGAVVTVAVDFKSDTGATCAEACIYQMPPAALRSAFFEFWNAFDEELPVIVADDQAKAAEARKRRPGSNAKPKPKPQPKRKPPSDWVMPPSGWKPPPK